MKPDAPPFRGAACEKRLMAWIDIILTEKNKFKPKYEWTIINQCNYKPFFPDSFNFHPVVALGEVASRALTKSGIKHFKLPHPSGNNRLINNKEFIADKLSDCKEWIDNW